MKNVLSITCMTIALLFVSTSIGCGGSEEPAIVGGVTQDFLAEIEAGQANYAKDMQASRSGKR
jgi:hypothetical protein